MNKRMDMYWRILACLLLMKLAVGCKSDARQLPPDGDMRAIISLNTDAIEAIQKFDINAALAAMQAMRPHLFSQQDYTNRLYTHDEKMTAKVVEWNEWWIGPKGWRTIYWIIGIGAIVAIAYEVASFYGLGIGGLALRFVAKLTKGKR